jgi:hypothetical protein
MIKLKSLITESSLEELDKKYPLAGSIVDGREVLKDIHNITSIGSSLENYKILKGIREVPMTDFQVTGRHYSVEGDKKIEQLSQAILQSNKISPLIVVVDSEGPYVLEGSTRIDALKRIKAKSFPALVVLDLE